MRPVLRGGHIDAATVQKAVARIAKREARARLSALCFVCLFVVMQVRQCGVLAFGAVCVYVCVRARTRHAHKLLGVDRWVDNE